MKIIKAKQNDVPVIVDLINSENEVKVSKSYIENWYWNKPSGGSSVQILQGEESEIFGISSTNNFEMNINNEKKVVAFPQKVVTSMKVRGQGFFSKLYWATEQDNLENENVDYHLTFTNHLSTPIFLKKFGYIRGYSPEIITLSPNIFKPSGYKCSLISNLETIEFDCSNSTGNNCFSKNLAYYKWRYTKEKAQNETGYIYLQVEKNNSIDCILILKKIKKKGLPILALVDAMTSDGVITSDNINIARSYCLSQKTIGLMILNNTTMQEASRKLWFKYILKNQLNFLVKGKTESETEELSKIKFNFNFGDLDFF